MSEEESKKENQESTDSTEASSAGATVPMDQEEEVEIDEDLAEALGAVETGEEVDVDQAIAEVDPNFGSDLAAISSQDFSGVVIDKNEASEEVDENAEVPSAYRTLWNNLPSERKTRVYVAMGILVILLPLALLIYMGKILPSFDLPYVLSMQELTQNVYSYPVDGVEVPLFDDFRTQAHTVQFPRTVINLRSQSGDPSYGEFEFSLMLRDEDLGVAVKAKQAEILDLMQRVLEQVTWQELQSPIGKEKVKKVIRHRINEYLQGNVVLGVYYRSVILEK